jgi:hypothetical protein
MKYIPCKTCGEPAAEKVFATAYEPAHSTDLPGAVMDDDGHWFCGNKCRILDALVEGGSRDE